MTPNGATPEHKKHAPRRTPARRTGILATEASVWPSLNFSTRRPLSRRDGLQGPHHAPVNKALLIGIQYERNNSWPNLRLAHKDVQSVKDMLVNVYQFDPKNIVVLMDTNKPGSIPPTKDIIFREIRLLMQSVEAGDQLYFHYSGHGEQVDCKVRDPTEDDGKDECIIPCDATENDSTWIVDNTLNDMLVKTLPVGSYLMAVFDMCHSGTALDLKNYYYAQEGTFVRRCTRKFTKISRFITKAFSRIAPRITPSPPNGSTSKPASRRESTDKMQRCLVIATERLSNSKFKSQRLTVSIDASPSPPKVTREHHRQFSMSKSEKVYKLECHFKSIIDAASVGQNGLGSPKRGVHPIMNQRVAEVERRRSGSNTPLSCPVSSEPITHALSLRRPSTFPPPQKSDNTVPEKDYSAFDLIPRLFRSFTDEHLWRTRKSKPKTKVDKEWNVFSGSLKKRRNVERAIRIDTTLSIENKVMDGSWSLRPVARDERATSETILPLGYIFESPPSSPVVTGQVISIGASDDAQVAMEYACKDENNKYKLMSLTATLVEILSKDPHPTLANLMVHLRVWLKNSSEEMHKHYEARQANPPSSPKTSEERREDEVQSFVLHNRPVQEPVLGTQIKTDINAEIVLPFSLRTKRT